MSDTAAPSQTEAPDVQTSIRITGQRLRLEVDPGLRALLGRLAARRRTRAFAVGDDPTCVFAVDAELVLALEAAYGPPIDSYLNGWQVWLEPCGLRDADDEPIELEHRLHPPAGFEQPAGLSHHDLWDEVVGQLAEGAEVLQLGSEQRRLDEVWRLLEVYPAFGDELSPEEIRSEVEDALRRPALGAGPVDHTRLGSRWKRTSGRFDLAGALLDELGLSD